MDIIIDLHRINNECEEAYTWRLGQAKDTGLLDMDWDEIAALINKEFRVDDIEYTSAAYRKPYSGAKRYFEAGVFNILCNDQYFKEIEIQRRELEKERQKLYATKTEYTRSIRQQSRFELFYENVRREIKVLTPPEYICSDSGFQRNDKCYVLTIADIHAGANFKTETNLYSFDEIKRRFDQLFTDVVHYIEQNYINTIKILCLGDDIQGILRLSDLQLNESSTVTATVFVAQMLAGFLNSLSAYCDIEYYHCPSSNHSQVRPLGTKSSEIASEDVEYIIGHYVQDMLARNDRVEVHLNFGHEYIEIPIFDYTAIAMHGHQLSNIDNALKDLSFQKKKFYVALFMAHYHATKLGTVGELANADCEVIVCPAFVGTCPYSEKLLKGAKPACCIYGFDRYAGHIDTHKILLNEFY